MNKVKLIIFVFLFFTTGCLNYTELNDIGIINSIGINKKGNNYIININMLTPTEKDLQNNNVYEIESNSLNEAFDKLYLKTSKQTNLSHLELLILSNNLTKDDYDNIKDFFINRTDSRNTFNVIMLENYTRENVFKFTQEEINNLISTNNSEDGLVSPKSFDEMLEDILSIKISYIPLIEIHENMNILGYKSIYEKNKTLSKKESIAYNFITNKIKRATIVDNETNIKIDKSITNIKINKDIITININSTIMSNDSNQSITEKYNKLLKSYINDFINKYYQDYFYKLIEKYTYNKYKAKDIKFIINIKSKYNMEVYK